MLCGLRQSLKTKVSIKRIFKVWVIDYNQDNYLQIGPAPKSVSAVYDPGAAETRSAVGKEAVRCESECDGILHEGIPLWRKRHSNSENLIEDVNRSLCLNLVAATIQTQMTPAFVSMLCDVYNRPRDHIYFRIVFVKVHCWIVCLLRPRSSSSWRTMTWPGSSIRRVLEPTARYIRTYWIWR